MMLQNPKIILVFQRRIIIRFLLSKFVQETLQIMSRFLDKRLQPVSEDSYFSLKRWTSRRILRQRLRFRQYCIDDDSLRDGNYENRADFASSIMLQTVSFTADACFTRWQLQRTCRRFCGNAYDSDRIVCTWCNVFAMAATKNGQKVLQQRLCFKPFRVQMMLVLRDDNYEERAEDFATTIIIQTVLYTDDVMFAQW